ARARFPPRHGGAMSQLTISPDLWSRLEALVHENAAWPVENHEEIEHTVAELRRLVADQQRLLERKTAREDQLNARVAQLEQYIEQVATQSLRYRELFDCAPDAYLVTDAAGAIEKANHAAAALFRVPRELLLNKPMPFFIVHERRLELYQRLNALIRRQQAISNWEVPMQPRGGLVLTTLVTVTPIVDADGMLQGLRWLVRDVSELHQARVRALQLERLAVLGQRAADLAHDGRNLLSRAQAFLQRLTWRLEESGEALDFVKRAMDANNDLVLLSNDVWCSAGPFPLESAPCDLPQ